MPAGIDRFAVDQIQHFFAAGLAPDVPVDKILALGRENYDDGDPSSSTWPSWACGWPSGPTAWPSCTASCPAGCSPRLWPGFDQAEVPITSVTNGVHVPTWVDPASPQLARDRFGADADAGRWDQVYNVSDEDVWAMRREMRVSLVDDVRRRLRASWKKRGAADAELAWTDAALDPDILTIGFARRVPTYKRLTLMLREPERLKALLLHPSIRSS